MPNDAEQRRRQDIWRKDPARIAHKQQAAWGEQDAARLAQLDRNNEYLWITVVVLSVLLFAAILTVLTFAHRAGYV